MKPNNKSTVCSCGDQAILAFEGSLRYCERCGGWAPEQASKHRHFYPHYLRRGDRKYKPDGRSAREVKAERRAAIKELENERSAS